MKKQMSIILLLALLMGCFVFPTAAESEMRIEFADSSWLPSHYTYDDRSAYQASYLLTPGSQVTDFSLYESGPADGPDAYGSTQTLYSELVHYSKLDRAILLKLEDICGAIPKFAISYVDGSGVTKFYSIQENTDGWYAGNPVELVRIMPYQCNGCAVPFTVEIGEGCPCRSSASRSGKINSYIKHGKYTIVEVKNGWGKLKSGSGWVYMLDESYFPVSSADSMYWYPSPPFTVTVGKGGIDYYTSSNGAGYSGHAKEGKYTIIEISGDYGKLKSGAGWVNLQDRAISAIG